MLNQGLMQNHEAIVDYFSMKGVSMIFLFRRNLLRRRISVHANAYDESAKPLDGKHKSHVHSPDEAKILACYKPSINTTLLIPELQQADNMVKQALEYFNTTRHIILYYEDIVRNHTCIDCVGTGTDVECFVPLDGEQEYEVSDQETKSLVELTWEWVLLVSPFFFWGTAMVAMKEILPKTGPVFVSAFRLVPAGLLLVAFAGFRGRKMPSGVNAWFSIALFALLDATCFQGFLAKGLEKTSAGLGSVIIDSQPLTVAVLASLLYGESIGLVGIAGLVLGVVGLALLELPAISSDENNFSLWGSGEWWMLLAAQSMAVGTVMVRWVSKYSDPVMATGWHMVLGGIPLAAVSILAHDPAVSGGLTELTTNDLLALLYTSVFGSAISYGLYFYNATRGSLTKLSSLTFLTPMFASVFGFLYLSETFSPVQLTGAVVTVAAIYMVNYKNNVE